MFFTISEIEQAAHHADGLQNPKNPSHPMVLGIYRTQSRTAFFTVYSKKAYGKFWDDVERKEISRRQWTPEMKNLVRQKVAETPKPPFVFKFTIVGWIFVLLIIGFFGYLIYDSNKPPLPKTAEYVAMEQAPIAGDRYFGRYEAFKEAGDRIASSIGFGWFKVVKVEGDVYYIARSTEMSKTSKSKEQMNNTDFEVDGTPAKITEQAGYMVNMKAVDGKMEIYFTDKR